MKTNQQILEKAIQKAIDGGWKGTPYMRFGGDWMGDPPKWEVKQPFKDAVIVYTTGGVNNMEIHINTEHVIFNHDFAKALWGEWDMVESGSRYQVGTDKVEPVTRFLAKSWQYHLQQMVVADDPIKYLGENI